jgi:hypothetical protein
LTAEERESLREILEHAEAFQPHLTEWIMAIREAPAAAGSSADADECARSLDRMAKHLSNLELLLAKVGGNRRAG